MDAAQAQSHANNYVPGQAYGQKHFSGDGLVGGLGLVLEQRSPELPVSRIIEQTIVQPIKNHYVPQALFIV